MPWSTCGPAGGCWPARCPTRVVRPARAALPDAKVFEEFASGSGRQSVSTTMVFARLLRNLVRDPTIGPLVAPIVSDEARTFGLESIIAEAKIFAPEGQHYVPVDADLPLHYAESTSGQVLQEGITEAGALASFTALATAYATWGHPMLPVFLFYSMFGFQRVGDLTWALGDIRGRGILAGCTAGRTTLQGEGLQHDDGHSPLLASVQPGRHDLRRLVRLRGGGDHAGRHHPHPRARIPRTASGTSRSTTRPIRCRPCPKGEEGEDIRRGIVDGIYRFSAGPETGQTSCGPRCASPGPMWSVAQEAQELLASAGGSRPTPGR